MFRYLVFFGAAFYLALLIGGEDRGQQRMGLRGAYDVALAPPAPAAQPETAPDSVPVQVAARPAETAAPADSLRVLPAAAPAMVQSASLTEAPATPGFNDFNNPQVTLRTITADAANVRAAPGRNAAVIGRLERGEIVQVVAETEDWIHIRIEGDGVDGFVHRRLISREAPSLSSATLFPAAD